MADEDVVYRITIDQGGAVQSVEQLQKAFDQTGQSAENAGRSLTEYNQGSELASKVTDTLIKSVEGLFIAMARGSDIDDVTQAFDKFAKKAGVETTDLLKQLQVATAGTVDNLHLMQGAVEQLRAGLKPTEIVDMTKAARVLAEEGGSLSQNIDQLSRALETGRARALQNKLGIIDLKGAEEQLAATLGVKAAALSTEGKLLADRAAIMDAVNRKSKEFGDIEKDAGDRVGELKAGLANVGQEFLKSLAANDELNKVLDKFVEIIQNADFSVMENGLIRLAVLTGEATNSFLNFFQVGGGFGQWLANVSGATKPFEEEMEKIVGLLGKDTPEATQKAVAGFNSLVTKVNQIKDPALYSAVAKGLQQIQEQLVQSQKNFGIEGEQVQKNTETKKEAKTIADRLKEAIDAANGSLIDSEKANAGADAEAKKYAKSLEDLKNKIESLTGTGHASGLGLLDQELYGLLDQYRNNEISADALAVKLLALGQAFGDTPEHIREFEKELEEAKKRLDDFYSGFEKGKGKGNGPDSLLDGLLKGLGLSKEKAGATQAEIAGQVNDIVGGAIAQGLQNVLQNALNGTLKGNQVGAAVGQAGGAAIGGSIGGPIGAQIGSQIGAVIGDKVGGGISAALKHIFGGGNNPDTKARGQVDDFFNKIFDANNIQGIIDGQLQKLEFHFPGLDELNSGTFDSGLKSLSGGAQAAFLGIGDALNTLLGTGQNIGEQIAAALDNSVGGSLTNLQLLIQSTGFSFDQLEGAVRKNMEQGKLDFISAKTELDGIKTLAQQGIPQALGATNAAFDHLVEAGIKGGNVSIKALKDIAAEAQEVHLTSLEQLQQRLIAEGENAESVQKLIEALRTNGIKNINDLSKAGEDVFINILAQLQAAKFPFADTSKTLGDIADTLNKIPSEKDITLNIHANVDPAASQFVNLPAGTSTITTGRSPGLGAGA